MPIDSHVTVATQGHDTKCCSIQNAYRIKDGLPLISTAPVDWRPGQTLPPTGRRDNYRGITISAATVVSDEQRFVQDIINTERTERLTLLSASVSQVIEDKWDNFLDIRYRHLNTLSKCNFVLMTYIATTLNFT
jgi:hypothetical protein